jgi:uncharacterized protein (TIGR02266 family)
MVPIALGDHSSLTERLLEEEAVAAGGGGEAARAREQEQPILLTKKKRPTSEKPRLEVIAPAELADTQPPRRADDTMPGPFSLPDTRPPLPDTRPPIPPTVPPPANTVALTRVSDRRDRRFRRFPLKIEVGYTSDHNFYTGFLQNVSSGGLFVATHTPAKIGELLELSFTVPGLGRTCTVVCRVRWVREFDPLQPEMVPGMGLQFSQLDADTRAAIDLFIAHREPIFYDDG